MVMVSRTSSYNNRLINSISTERLPNTGLRDLRALLHQLADGEESQWTWSVGAGAPQGLASRASIPRRLQRPQHGTRETRTLRTRQEDKQTLCHCIKTLKYTYLTLISQFKKSVPFLVRFRTLDCVNLDMLTYKIPRHIACRKTCHC